MISPPPPTERVVQRRIIAMMGLSFPDVFVHHSPNGAHLAGNEASRFKQVGALLGDGMRKGFPDLICFWGPPPHFCFMEVKRPKLGKLSKEQSGVIAMMRDMHIPVAVVTSEADAYDFLISQGAPWSRIKFIRIERAA